MPYSGPSDAPDNVPEGKKAQWVEVWNSAYKAAKKDGKNDKDAEDSAFKQAYGVIKSARSGFMRAETRELLKDGTRLAGFVTDEQNKPPRECGACRWQSAGLCSHPVVMIDPEVEGRDGEPKAVGPKDCCDNFQNKKDNRSQEMKTEYRFLAELRAEGQGDEMALTGYAALFNSDSKNLGGFKERIAPGAFTRTLKEGGDVKALVNHDPNQLLGRTKNGTLKLEQDDRGLKFRVVLNPESQAHRDLHASIKRGDMDECSFAFTVPEGGQDWQDVEGRGNEDFYSMRTLKDVNLLDVSTVTYPAYANTSVGARSFFPDGMPQEIRSAIERGEKRAAEGSYEHLLGEICNALNEKFPALDDQKDWYGPNAGRFWVLETYPDHVIVAEPGEKFWSISYHEDEANETFLFGEPQAIEQKWVPADERGAKRIGELRSALAAIAEQHASAAADHAAKAKAEQEAADAIKAKEAEKKAYREDAGLLEDEDYEDNQYVDPQDVYSDEGEESDARAARLKAETRADGKVLTKKVGDKNLTKDKFAWVGDPQKTETWKLPIHDAAHVRNALARFNQTQGIPAEKKAGVYRKIVAAAKKFGIEVSDADSKRMLESLPYDEQDIADKARLMRAYLLDRE